MSSPRTYHQWIAVAMQDRTTNYTDDVIRDWVAWVFENTYKIDAYKRHIALLEASLYAFADPDNAQDAVEKARNLFESREM